MTCFACKQRKQQLMYKSAQACTCKARFKQSSACREYLADTDYRAAQQLRQASRADRLKPGSPLRAVAGPSE